MSVDAKVKDEVVRKGFALQDCELSKAGSMKESEGNGKVRKEQLPVS